MKDNVMQDTFLSEKDKRRCKWNQKKLEKGKKKSKKRSAKNLKNYFIFDEEA